MTNYPVALLANDGQQASLAHYTQLAKDAEAKGIDFFVLNEEQADIIWEPQILLAHLTAQTSTIGLGVPIGVAYAEPYHVARILATIDRFSKGRVSFEAKPYALQDTSAQYLRNVDATTAPALSAELLDVVTKLWDSWDDDAVLNDKENGQFLDTTKIRHIDHVGEHFKVRGPNPAPRPVQGHVPRYAVIKDTVTALDATADIVFLTGNVTQVEEVYKQLTAQKVFVAQDIAEQLSFTADGVFITPAQLANFSAAPKNTSLRERLQLARPELVAVTN